MSVINIEAEYIRVGKLVLVAEVVQPVAQGVVGVGASRCPETELFSLASSTRQRHRPRVPCPPPFGGKTTHSCSMSPLVELCGVFQFCFGVFTPRDVKVLRCF